LVDLRGNRLTAADIYEKTGIDERRVVSSDQNPLSMGVAAARQVVERSENISSVIFTTSFPIPGFNHADGLVDQLGIEAPYTEEVAAACSGFVRALSNIQRSPEKYGKNVLVVSSEAYSPYTVKLNKGSTEHDPSMAEFLFSDGAVATKLNMNRIELISSISRHYDSEDIVMPVDYSAPVGNTDYVHVPKSENGKFMQHGPRVIEFIRKLVGSTAFDAIEKANLTPEKIKMVLAHQPSMPGVRNLSIGAHDLLIPAFYERGNRSSGSIPSLLMALCEGNIDFGFKNGKFEFGDFSINSGDTVLFQGFGAGAQIESVVARIH